MSLHLEMLQVARLAPGVLGDSTELVARFVTSRQNMDGGFADRQGVSDLYYTVFALDSLLAVHPVSACLTDQVGGGAREYVQSFGQGEGLDFVHLCCLARCRAALHQAFPQWDMSSPTREGIGSRLASFRSGDGGFHPRPQSETTSAYGVFLGWGAMQDLGLPLAKPESLWASLSALATDDGGFANEARVKTGATNATAAVVAVGRNLGRRMPDKTGSWLLSMRHGEGGFKAGPGVPMPDLLSTATALHALSGLGMSMDPVRESCLDYIDTLWTNEGGFHGHWADDALDVEYTYYGLLALGHLSV